MNKTAIFIAGGVLVVGALGAIIYSTYISYDLEDEDKPGIVINDTEEQHTIGDFLFGGASSDGLKCEYVTSIAGQGTLTVTSYIAGGRVAVHYTSVPPLQGQDNMHVVSNEEFAYIWGDAYLTNGMKGFKIDLAEDPNEEERDASPVDYDAPLDNCIPWQPVEDEFMIPSGVEFQTMAEMMGGIMFNDDTVVDEADEDTVEADDQCAVCSMLPADQQEQCLQAMGCN